MSDQQNFPQVGGPVLDPRGNFTQEWLAFFRAMWNRTGGAPGSSGDADLLFALSRPERGPKPDLSAQMLALAPPKPRREDDSAKLFALMVLGQRAPAPAATTSNVYADFVAGASLVEGFVNLYSAAGAFKVRQADQSLSQTAHGYVLGAVSSGATARVYFDGIAGGFSGLTPGFAYLGTSGLASSTAGTTYAQSVGVAKSATEVIFMPQEGTLL